MGEPTVRLYIDLNKSVADKLHSIPEKLVKDLGLVKYTKKHFVETIIKAVIDGQIKIVKR